MLDRKPDLLTKLNALKATGEILVLETRIGSRMKGKILEIRTQEIPLDDAILVWPTSVVLSGDRFGGVSLADVVSMRTLPPSER